MNKNGLTMVEICVAILITALLAGGITIMFINYNRHNQTLDQKLHFSTSAQVLFEVLKTDLRSLKKIEVMPEKIDIEKVTDFNSEGEEISETVSFEFANGVVNESRGDRRLSYQFLNDGMKKLGQKVNGSFGLLNSENSDKFTSGTFIARLSVADSSGTQLPGFEASMSMDIRWLNPDERPGSP
ncbi:MAG: hypothetical protein AB1403_01715 [Candidatus Riflebacteria bacterium]